MSEVVQGTPQEFWRPPSPGDEASSTAPISKMAQACSRCGSEFLLGSHFCHSCGTRRAVGLTDATRADAAAVANLWQQAVDGFQMLLGVWHRAKFPAWLQYLHFHEIKRRIGLSTASLIAFVIGLACVAGALLVGLLTAKTLVDWQAIQFYRAEWLLAATASFVAGILLKKRESESESDD